LPVPSIVRAVPAASFPSAILLRPPSAPPAPFAPAFTHRAPEDWLNSAPLSWREFCGKVVLLGSWSCLRWNCHRFIPWLNSMEERHAPRGLRVVGVHTPELAHERGRANVLRKAREFGIRYPVMLDDDYSYWSALGNRYRPTFHLVDKQGHVRGVFAGETHRERAAQAIESTIEALLAEELE
jgi:hypothetical protein